MQGKQTKAHYFFEVKITYLMVSITLFASILFTLDILNVIAHEKSGLRKAIDISFFIVIYYLIYGNLVYQFTRIGYLKRRIKHTLENLFHINQFFNKFNFPKVTVLIPSYKEDPEVIGQTLLSATLQQYPNKRIVLLIDDPANPKTASDINLLAYAQNLPQDIKQFIEPLLSYLTQELNEVEARVNKTDFNYVTEIYHLIDVYNHIIDWFEGTIENYRVATHTDKLFVKKIFTDHFKWYEQKIFDLEFDNETIEYYKNSTHILKEYQRLVGIYTVNISTFQRKKYVNLSHEPNKAMNLNSYIGLIGNSFTEQQIEGKLYLQQAQVINDTSINIPDTDYIITLDADSILLPEYALRLVHFMQQPKNKKIAIAQTPYSSIPETTNILERVAGATTDIQYLIHQGFTHYSATFWVGANALIRKSALNDIHTTERERGFKINKYIQDRTVIEDTESTIDLVHKGWQLFNYPERLSYSATPPDFGSLLIQRKRWANGGLIILPKLIIYLIKTLDKKAKISEGFIRFHYLSSIGIVSYCILSLIVFPFGDKLSSVWLPLTAVPYYVLYARDLRYIGYKFTDLLRIYAFNMMLIPINISGAFTSIIQAITGKKIPFGRTPKVQGRTAAPIFYIVAEYLIFFYCVWAFMIDILGHKYNHAIFSFFNILFFAYVIIRFIGAKESIEDIKAQLFKKSS